MLVKLKNMFCYCGATKEQYNSFKKDAYISNFVLWKSLNIVMVILFTIRQGTLLMQIIRKGSSWDFVA